MESIPFLTKDDITSIDQVLSDYLQKSEADLVIIADKGGTIIAQYGNAGSIDTTIASALAAGSFAATQELAARVGETEFKALYHQGNQHHIFMGALDENSIMITIFGQKTTIGLVRFYSTRVSTELVDLLKKIRSRDPSENALPPSGVLSGVSRLFASH